MTLPDVDSMSRVALKIGVLDVLLLLLLAGVFIMFCSLLLPAVLIGIICQMGENAEDPIRKIRKFVPAEYLRKFERSPNVNYYHTRQHLAGSSSTEVLAGS